MSNTKCKEKANKYKSQCEFVKCYNDLAQEVMVCEKCDLGYEKLLDGYDPHVMGQGSNKSSLVFVAEAPGKQETIYQQPLTTTGVSGKLYESVLKDLGLTRNEVYTTNIVLCRPSKNRDPEPWEVKKCHEYFVRQLDLIKPKLVVTFGRFAAQTMLGNFKITKEHGVLKMSNKFDVLVFPMYHPSYIQSYAPISRRGEWKKDVLTLKEILDNGIVDA